MSQAAILMAHPSPDLYGSDRVLLETVSAFITAGRRVVVVLPEDGPLAPALRERGAEVEYCPTPVLRKSYLSPIGLVRLVVRTLTSLPGSVRTVRRVRPDLILVNTVTIPVWVLIGRVLGLPVICHVHEAEGSASGLVRRVLYLPLLAASGLVVNSRFSLDVLTATWRVLGRRSRVVYNGVPGPEDTTPPRAALDQARLLFIGRLSPRKGPQVAVAALEQLVAAGVSVRLDLLGAAFPGYEWFEQQLREQVRAAGLDELVGFLGFDPDIWSRLAGTDIVVVPSTLDEPFGNTAVEAMLAQRPLVVSATSGLREAAAGYAMASQVPPSDPAAIAAAVRALIANWTEVVAHSEADRRLAVQRHAPEVYRGQILATINELARRPQRDPAR